MSSLNVGDFFKIQGQKHWGNGEIHCATKVQRERVTGNPDVPVLDLGIMVEFALPDFFGKPMRHAIPIEWCVPCERPSIARRVK